MTRLFIKRRLRRAIGQSSAMLGAAMIAMLWFGIAWKYQDQAATERRAAAQNGANLARLFEENVVRTIGEVDKALLHLRRRIQASEGSGDLRNLLSSPEVLSDTIHFVAFIDAAGILRNASSGPRPPPTDLSDREHFRAHLGGAKDELFVGRPIVGRVSGKWLIPLTRRLDNKDGSFAGVLVAALDPEHFAQFYKSIDLGRSGSVSLFGLDGSVRATGGADSRGRLKLGQNISGMRVLEVARKQPSGTFVEPAQGAAGSRLVTVRQVRGLSLAVSTSVTEAQIFEGSRTDLLRHSLVGLLLTLAILAVSARSARGEARLRLATAKMLRSQRRALQKSELLRLTLDNMGQGILLVTGRGRIPVMNQQAVRLLDLPERFLHSAPSYVELAAFQKARGETTDTTVEGMAATEASAGRDGEAAHPVCECTRPDGTVLEVRTTALPDGGFVRTLTDITRRRQAQEAVAKIASQDTLTGLGNRRLLKEELESLAVQRPSLDAPRDVEDQGFALLCLDLDLFKVVNDTLGHWIGDALLKAVAERLIATVRAGHLVVRLGGDEFAILLPRAQSTEQPEALARRLLEVVGKPFEIHGQQVQIGASIGIALAPHDGTEPDLLLKAADMALYAAKAAGRSTYRFFHKSMADRLRAKRQLEIDLRAAIDNDDLELHYQPLLNVADKTISGFEALMRWQHPLRGMISPGEFIPIAEETGLIVPLGAWALRKACEQAATWPGGLYVAVNVSPTQFRGGNLVATVAEILGATGLAASRLELEITETILMQESDPSVHILHQLRELGVRIAMDDFGTGYSSLSYLRSFPLDKIKIDRAFVKDLRTTAASDVIIRSVIDIAKTLQMATTAEGVETREQFEQLAALGCSEAQGYYLSKAVPVSQVPGLIAKWSANGASIAA
jgi:diguanylate cyclase (GGDEF)-like protein